jgi:hypothetical protein
MLAKLAMSGASCPAHLGKFRAKEEKISNGKYIKRQK